MVFLKRFQIFSCLALLAVASLTGCENFRRVEEHITTSQEVANEALSEITPSPVRRNSLVVDRRPWFGSRAVPIEHGEPLPAILAAPDALVVTFERPVQLREVARMIQNASGLRVSVYEDTEEETSQKQRSLFLPSNGREVAGGRVVWQGNLYKLLDQVADTFDAEWSFDGNVIRIENTVSRVFMLHALAGNVQIGSDLESESGGTDGSLPEIGFSAETTLEIWDEIHHAIAAMLDDRGKIALSPSTGTITVTGPPSLVSRVENYLRDQNQMRLRRVAIAVKVLAVETSNINEVAFRLSAIIQRALNGKPFELKSVGGGLTAGILRSVPEVDEVTGFTAPDAGGNTVTPDTDVITSVLEASEEIERATVVQSGAIVTLSDIPAPLQIGRIIRYLERITTTVDDGDTTTSLEPGEVNLGLTMNVLPRVIEKDRVLLRLAIGIKDAQTPFRTFSSGGVSIQLPEVETTGFVQNAVLASGETLVLAGFEKNQSGYEQSGTPGGIFTGGTQEANRSREVSVLLITAEILPEEPLTVLGE